MPALFRFHLHFS